jgi:hypothetical protein
MEWLITIFVNKEADNVEYGQQPRLQISRNKQVFRYSFNYYKKRK